MRLDTDKSSINEYKMITKAKKMNNNPHPQINKAKQPIVNYSWCSDNVSCIPTKPAGNEIHSERGLQMNLEKIKK